MDDHERIYSAFLPTPIFCPLCRARRFTLDAPCQSCQRHEKARQNPSFPLERFRCSKCKSFRPITDYPLDRQSNFRAATCSVCHARRRDEYCEGKGEPVSKEGRARRFRRAQRVVEKALQGRIREERLKGHWLKARERWVQGESYYRKGFEEGVYREGPYRQWAGYTDPRGSTGVGESLREGSQGEESWEGLTDEEGSSTGLQDGWGGFPGENGAWEGSTGGSEAWEGPREEREGSTGEGTGSKGLTGASGAWEHPRESRESSIAPVEGPYELQETRESPQEQYCSSCNRRKPLTDFGQFFTCNTCREQNKRANRARRTRVKKAVPPRPKATKQQLERVIQARASTSEYKLSFNKATRPITIEDYLNISSS
jgi:hypothetical protein